MCSGRSGQPWVARIGRRVALEYMPVHNVSVKDGLLFMDMRQGADALAGWHVGLDYSVQSLDALDAALASPDDARPATRDAGAYLGEVLIRHGGFAWGWPARHVCERGDEPALRAHGTGWVDVFAEIRRRKASRRQDPDDTLSRFAEQVLGYSSSPTEVTAGRLGLKKKYMTQSNWDQVRWDCQRIRARLRGWRKKASTARG